MITENSQNGNDLDSEDYTSNQLRSECADCGIECGERKKETKMTESVTKQRDARKSEAPAKCEHRCSCWCPFDVLSECHDVTTTPNARTQRRGAEGVQLATETESPRPLECDS